MNFNYQIMSENQKKDGKYYPDYDKLIANANCEEEKGYIEQVKKRNFPFAFNMVYITKQKCGHFEIYQTPQNEHYSIEENLSHAKEHAEKSSCSHCICNFR